MILAYEIDTATVNWVVACITAASVPAGALIWRWCSQFVAFIKPHIVGFFTSHKAFVDTFSEQIPRVTETLEKFGETLAKHDALHEQHANKLDKIINKIGAS